MKRFRIGKRPSRRVSLESSGTYSSRPAATRGTISGAPSHVTCVRTFYESSLEVRGPYHLPILSRLPALTALVNGLKDLLVLRVWGRGRRNSGGARGRGGLRHRWLEKGAVHGGGIGGNDDQVLAFISTDVFDLPFTGSAISMQLKFNVGSARYLGDELLMCEPSHNSPDL